MLSAVLQKNILSIYACTVSSISQKLYIWFLKLLIHLYHSDETAIAKYINLGNSVQGKKRLEMKDTNFVHVLM